MPVLKQQDQVLFSAMKDNSSVFFYLKSLYFGQKEPVEVKFSDF